VRWGRGGEAGDLLGQGGAGTRGQILEDGAGGGLAEVGETGEGLGAQLVGLVAAVHDGLQGRRITELGERRHDRWA
jgi:hypothetical protein